MIVCECNELEHECIPGIPVYLLQGTTWYR
jgi:hypothetical protein